MRRNSIVIATVALAALFAVAGCSGQQGQTFSNYAEEALGGPDQKAVDQDNQQLQSEQRQIEQNHKEIQTLQAKQNK
jgi:TolA-binding protein